MRRCTMFNGGVRELGMIGRSAVLCVRPPRQRPNDNNHGVRSRPGTQDGEQQGMRAQGCDTESKVASQGPLGSGRRGCSADAGRAGRPWDRVGG